MVFTGVPPSGMMGVIHPSQSAYVRKAEDRFLIGAGWLNEALKLVVHAASAEAEITSALGKGGCGDPHHRARRGP